MLTEHKRAVLRERNYVFLDGKWRHKGDESDLSGLAVEFLGDEDFESGLDRYVSALDRQIHMVHLGAPILCPPTSSSGK